MTKRKKPLSALSSGSERRTNWRDRRVNDERRNEVRLSHMDGECRNNPPRRASDVAGKLIEGDLWWGGSGKFMA